MEMTASSEQSFRLNDLPIELIRKILSFLEPSECTELALVNKFYYKAAMEQILSKYVYSRNKDLEGFELRRFLKTLKSDDGDYLWCLKDLELRNEWYDKLDENEPLSTEEAQEKANEFGRWLMSNCTGIQSLHVAYPENSDFLKKLPHRLRNLVVRPRGRGETEYNRNCFPEIEYKGILDVHFLPKLLKSRSCSSLDIGAELIVNDGFLFDLPAGRSHVEHLIMKVGNFHDEAMARLLGAPQNLKTFHFSPFVAADGSNEANFVGRQWPETEYTRHLPTMSVIGAALEAHANSLQELTLLRGHSFWYPKMDSIRSFANFTSLRYLNTSIATILGYQHCGHNDSAAEKPPLHPSKLAEHLPPNLETLEFFHDQHHQARHGRTYFLDIIKGLIAACCSSRLQALRRVILGGTQPYCPFCDCETVPEPFDAKAVSSHYMSIQEARAIKEVMSNEEPPFEFFSRHDGLYWNEGNTNYVVNQHVFERTIEEAEEEDDGWSKYDERYPRLASVPEKWSIPDCGASETGRW